MSDSPLLQTLAQHRDPILLAEIGALIHDLGKLSREFIAVKSGQRPTEQGWWSDDFHADVVGLHQLCAIPPTLQTYIDSSTGSVDVVTLTQNAAKQICHAIEQVFNSRLQAGETAVLQDTAERRLTTARDVAGLKSQLNILFRYEERQGTWGGSLKAAVENRYGKDSRKSVQLVTALAEGWAEVDANIVALRSDIDALLSHENRLLREAVVASDFLPPDFKMQLMTSIALGAETIYIKDLLEMHHRDHWNIPSLVHLLRASKPEREDEERLTARGEPEGCDGLDSAMDKQLATREGAPQEFNQTFIATAFGHETQRLPVGPGEDGLKPVRHQFAHVLTEALRQVRDGQATPAQVRPRILKAVETAFRQALGETRRAANDVTLWDHSYSVASLYKAALAKVLLEGQWTEPGAIDWRFLRLSVDGLGFFSRAHHVPDILGRRRALSDALDQVRQTLEIDYPLGNEVYRDENGSIFVMPALNDPVAQASLTQEVEALVRRTFRQAGLGEELAPQVTWNDQGPVREAMITAFGRLVAQPPPSPTPDPQSLSAWWREPQSTGKEICTVCGVRPIGYGVADLYPKQVKYYQEAADERKVCGPCLNRRGQRCQDWVTDSTERQRTIWIDEVADNNGRFALVVGRFVLDGWLDGKLVSTLLVAPGQEKNPSPARIRRCWDTTRQFWLDLVEGRSGQQLELIQSIPSRPFRLRINPANAAEINDALGAYHVYDWPLEGRITLSVVWVPPDDKGGGYFLTADNLWYLAGPEQLNFPPEAQGNEMQLLFEYGRRVSHQREVALLEPSGYGRPAEIKARVRLPREGAVSPVFGSDYTPFIPILAEPATFMVLAPADRALAVAKAIKSKYDTEMARVRDRLPLHLGLVFALRRTPLAAVLEAGRAMLEMPVAWQQWEIIGRQVNEKTLDDGRQVSAEAILALCPIDRRDPAELPTPDQPRLGDEPSDAAAARVHWSYPLLMGDGRTPDAWYPHLLLYEPNDRLKVKKEQGMVPQGRQEPELKKRDGDFAFASDITGTVFIRPSHFDFTFLDTTARRFEIHYASPRPWGEGPGPWSGAAGVRDRRTRPFLLDDLDRLERLWDRFGQLRLAQINQVIGAIEATRELWGLGPVRQPDDSPVFWQFVSDTLAGANWPKKDSQGRDCRWQRWSELDRRALIAAAASGELTDWTELHLHILKEKGKGKE